MESHNKGNDNNAKSQETSNESQSQKNQKSPEKNNNNVEASGLWMSRRKQVESSNESDKDDEGGVHRHVPNVMETGAMMRIASIIEKSKNSKHNSDNRSDDL